ncbi:MAG: protein translocase subunit SecF, partial [Lentisphaeria bacterium]
SIGLVANLFTSLVLSRSIYDLLLCYTPLKKLTMLHIFRHVPHFDFMGMRRGFFIFSGVLTVLAILLIGYRFHRNEALSTDFTGGVTMTYQYDKNVAPPPVDALRSAAAGIGMDRDVRIGYKSAGIAKENLLEITIPTSMEELKKVTPERVLAMLKDKFPAAKFEAKQTYRVGGLVGEQFKWYAICALTLSWVGIILYLAFRFEFAYGVAAVIAIVHDVIVATGVAALCDKQLSLTALAALLTIIGYSVNDTIVVFDRIRENFSLARQGSYADVVNLSINQTLSRTLLTSVTVFFCVLSLYLFGGGAINDFALIMLVGVVVGTYSSVFVASAIIVSWHKRIPLTPVPVAKTAYVDGPAATP